MNFRPLVPLFINVLVLIILGSWATPAHTQQSASGDMTLDEMLEYTISDLNRQIQDLKTENQRFTAKNESLRKRILFLREKSRECESQKLKFMAEYLELSREGQLEAKNFYSSDRRAKVRQGREVVSLEKQAPLKERFNQEIKLQQTLEKQINKLKGSLGKSSLPEKSKGVSVRPRLERQQRQMQDEFKIIQSRIQQQENRIGKTAEAMAALRIQNESLRQQRTDLERRLDSVQAELQVQIDQETGMKSRGMNFQDQRETKRHAVEEDILKLSGYRNELRKAVDGLRGVAAGVAQDASEDNGLAVKKFLVRERGLLEQQAKAVRERLEILEKQKKDPLTLVNLQNDFNLLHEAEKNHGRKNQILTESLGQEQRQQQTLQKDMERVRGEISTFERRHRDSELSARTDRHKGLSQHIERQKQKDHGLEQDIRRTSSRIEEMTKALTSEKTMAENLVKEFKDLETEIKDLEQHIPEEKPAPGEDPETMRKKIEQLRAQSAILTQALPLIQSRLDTDGPEAKEFKKEEQQLREYFDVLSQENAALKDKVLSLTETVKLLETRKGRSPGSAGDKN